MTAGRPSPSHAFGMGPSLSRKAGEGYSCGMRWLSLSRLREREGPAPQAWEGEGMAA